MVGASIDLTIAGAGGIVLTGGYIWWELGHYATPQVSENRFEDRRVIFAYTAGLFLGVVLIFPFLIFIIDMGNGVFLGAVILLAVVTAGIEAIQWGIRRTRYWGTGPAHPFYVVALRCGIAAIFILALLAEYFSGPYWAPTITVDGLAVVALDCLALVIIEVTCGLLSLPPDPSAGRTGGGPRSGGIFGAIGLLLVGFYPLAAGFWSGYPWVGELVGAGAAGVAIAGFLYFYALLRPIFDRIPPLSRGATPSAAPAESRYARKGSGG